MKNWKALFAAVVESLSGPQPISFGNIGIPPIL
jgi:hypothetical protein